MFAIIPKSFYRFYKPKGYNSLHSMLSNFFISWQRVRPLPQVAQLFRKKVGGLASSEPTNVRQVSELFSWWHTMDQGMYDFVRNLSIDQSFCSEKEKLGRKREDGEICCSACRVDACIAMPCSRAGEHKSRIPECVC